MFQMQAIYNPQKYARNKNKSVQNESENPGIAVISQNTLDDMETEMSFTQTGIYVFS